MLPHMTLRTAPQRQRIGNATDPAVSEYIGSCPTLTFTPSVDTRLLFGALIDTKGR